MHFVFAEVDELEGSLLCRKLLTTGFMQGLGGVLIFTNQNQIFGDGGSVLHFSYSDRVLEYMWVFCILAIFSSTKSSITLKN